MSLPGDKSIAHRTLMLAPLASGDSVIRNLPASRDVESTVEAMTAVGARVLDVGKGTVRVEIGRRLGPPACPLACGNSGTTARLLTGLLTGLGVAAELDGDASLRQRPMDRVVYPLQAMGGRIRYLGEPARLPIRIEARASGSLRRLRHRARVASAQVKSALLLAGLTGRTSVEVVEPARSRDHTERLLAWMGAPISTDRDGDVFTVRLDPTSAPVPLRPLDLDLPGDLSSAAFVIIAALLHRKGLTVERVGLNPTRTGFLRVLRDMGARIECTEIGSAAGEPWGTVAVEPSDLAPFRITGPEVPGLIDEIPALAMLAARIDGESEVSGAAELRVKESDRIGMIVGNLDRLGVDCDELEDGFRIRGSQRPLAGQVRTDGDHRIAMAFGVLTGLPGMRLRIDRPESVGVSFPDYWEQLRRVGGDEPGELPGGTDRA